MLFDFLQILFIIAILSSSYFISNLIAVKLKIKILRKLYRDNENFESTSFLFKLLLHSLTPFIFIIISWILAFCVPAIVNFIETSLFHRTPISIAISVTSLAVKIGLIWFIYRISSFSSINKNVNKTFAIFLLLSSLINFVGFNEYIIVFLGSFSANFGNFEVSIYKAFLSIVVLAGLIWLNKVLIESVKKILDTTKINTNTKALFVKFFSIILLSIAFLLGLSYLGFDLKSLTIFGSALVVGLGFGFQKLVSNVLSGITISFEEIVKEGDIILIDDKRELRGVVKSINMRYVLVREFDGKDIIIPNDTFLSSNICNLTHSNNSIRIRLDFLVPVNIDISKFQKDIITIMNKNSNASKFEENMMHIEAVTETGIKIFLHFWIDNPFEINAARTSVMLDILKYFAENNILLPAPKSEILLKNS